VAGLAAAALVGCGDDDDDDDDDDTAAVVTGDDDDAADDDAATGDDDDGDGDGDAMVAGRGELIQDPNLPFPYNFPEPDIAPKPGGTIVAGVSTDISTFDSTKTAASGTGRYVNMVYNRLLGFNRGVDLHPTNIEIRPELASSWERTPDGLTFTFHLRDDVFWQNIAPLNGRQFTAQDVKFAYDRYASEGVHQAYWVNSTGVEAPDDFTVQVNMAAAVADFIRPLASPYQSIHPRELVDSGEIESKVIGTGPMILDEAITSERVTYVKNPDYWEKEVLVDGVEFRVLPDGSARLAAFRAGQIDTGDIVVGNIREVENLLSTNPDTQVNITPVNSGQGFAMNLQNPKYQDERVRQAISLAIDRDLLLELLYQGLGVRSHYSPWLFVWDEQPTEENGLLGPWTRFDADESKKLLMAAGAEDLKMTNIFFPYSSAYEQTPDVLTDMFKDVGITMEGGSADYTEFNSQWVGAQLEDVTTGGWGSIGFDAENYFFNQIHSTAPGNRWRFNDPQLDEWAEAQQVELDPDARREIFRQMWTYELEKAYRPVIGGGSGFQIYQPWLHGIRFGGALSTTNIFQDWGDIIADGWLDK
jgi:peptide/nickel transport system substrate-binding protein